MFFFALSFLVLVDQGRLAGSADPVRDVSLALLAIQSFITFLYFFAVCDAFMVGS